MTQTTIFGQIAHARSTDPETSHDAARKLSDKATIMRALLLAYAGAERSGLTAHEATHRIGMTDGDGVWKRVSDLATLGWIAPIIDDGTPLTRTNPESGRKQRAWRITLEGLAQLD